MTYCIIIMFMLGAIYWYLAYRKKRKIVRRIASRLQQQLGGDIYRAREIFWLDLNENLKGLPQLTEETQNAIRMLKKDIARPDEIQ